MARFEKKFQLVDYDGRSVQRPQRRSRNQKSVQATALKQVRRHGWGYAKRRAYLEE